jgi:hypothetical protein|tara:strand:+ start:472 stop:693 length:222 start_codon:yes stop_codon:yes gene_type:complete
MSQIYWALAVVYFLNKPIDVVGVYQTSDQCEFIAQQYERAACYPVNVVNKDEVMKQINAINNIIINHENRNNN